MIPSIDEELMEDIEVVTEPSLSYRMHTNDEYINGTCDELEAVKQSVYKILNTERYQHVIYSWDYGVEFSDLMNEPVSYVCAELKRRITEALTQDDRIESVDGFKFDTSKKKEVVCTFTVHTTFGDIEDEKVVEI